VLPLIVVVEISLQLYQAFFFPISWNQKFGKTFAKISHICTRNTKFFYPFFNKESNKICPKKSLVRGTISVGKRRIQGERNKRMPVPHPMFFFPSFPFFPFFHSFFWVNFGMAIIHECI
jgi:hypothetical protein